MSMLDRTGDTTLDASGSPGDPGIVKKTKLSPARVIEQQLLARLGELGDKLGLRQQEMIAGSGEDDGQAMEVNASLSEIESREFAQVTAALAAFRNGTWRICAGCNGKIPMARMKAMPTATRCVPCQSEAEADLDEGFRRDDRAVLRQAAGFLRAASSETADRPAPDITRVGD